MTDLAEEVGGERQREQFARSSGRAIHKSSIHTVEPEMIDQDARDAAADAKAIMTSHERLCTERWDQQRQTSARIETALSEIRGSVNKRVGQLPASIISILMGLIGFLAAKAWPTH